jgi:adenine-specific DNA-methyltransferase
MFKVYNRRYTGSKLKLADWIIDTIRKNCQGDSFFEVFAGTSVVSAKIAPLMKRVILNDTLDANNVIYKAFYDGEKYSQSVLDSFKNRFREIAPASFAQEYFSINYGDKYFSNDDSKRIEQIRSILQVERESLSDKEYYILLASLIYSMDRSANTVGHYDAYIKKQIVGRQFEFDLIEPMAFPDTTFEIYQEDANTLVQRVKADIAYIDPPYNSRQYCQFYHIYETIVKWNAPELFGMALKPKATALSDYCRSCAPEAFADLIAKLNCKYLVVSYNNTYESKSGSSRNKITLEQITEILSRYGTVNTLSKSHQYFNAGKTDFADHKEFLFIVKRGEK